MRGTSLGIRRRQYILLIVLFYCFYLWLAAQIPYTHDDWEWGIEAGLKHFLSADINSRYVGNMIEIILTRSSLIKVIVMGSVFTALPVIISQLAVFCVGQDFNIVSGVQDTKCCLLLLSNILLLSMPVEIWQQTYGWVAGFSNFVTSGMLLLLFFCQSISFLKRDFDQTGNNLKRGG